MRARAPLFMTMQEISRIYGIPASTLYKWAKHDRWPHKGSRPRRYSVRAAQWSRDRHHPLHKHMRARHVTKVP